jgi:hypothetical protein
MTTVSLPECRGPRDLPEVRAWLANLYRPESRYTAAIENAGLSTDGRFIRETLNTAQLWWVTKETCDLLAASAPTIPDDVVMDWKDVPIPSGFAVFDEDLSGSDANMTDTEVRVSAIMWGPVELPPIGGIRLPLPGGKVLADKPGRIGLGIGMWTRADLGNGITGKEMAIHAGTFTALSNHMPELSTAVPGSVHVVKGTLFTYIGRTDWLTGRPINEVTPGAPLGSLNAQQSMTEDRKLITALWAITRTPIVSLVQEHVHRSTARRAKRKGFDPAVRVLTLHGPRLDQGTVEAHGTGTRDWQHSWVVSPHWRWQPFGPGRTQRRLILIGAYKKGPDDKPLLGAERVWRVVPPHGAPMVAQ